MNARQVAVKVISEIERDGSYSNIASDKAINDANLSRAEAGLASMLIYGVLQRKLTLDYILHETAGNNFKKTHPFVLSVLRVAAYQLLFMDKIPSSAAVNEAVKIVKASKQRFASGFVNAVLRKINDKKELLNSMIENCDDLCIKYSCTPEFLRSLVNDYGTDKAEQFLKASLESPKLYCRVNNFCVKDNLFERLTARGITVEKSAVLGAFAIHGAGNVEGIQEFLNGEFFVQDLASQTAILQLGVADGDCVLDVCAAPGGKSFTVAQYAGKNGRVVSCDIYPKRVNLVSSGAKRLNINTITAKLNDATVFDSNLGLFDRVVCDVPCSGWGVVRRKPEIKYKNIDDFGELKKIQEKILDTSVNYLKPDGCLMYSTCTLRKAENEDIVKQFLASHSEFEIVKEQTFMPQLNDSDGFYCCVIKRKISG